MQEQFRTALDELHALLDGDGLQFEFVEGSIRTKRLALRLNLDAVDCSDCVMPVEYLTGIATDSVRTSLNDQSIVITIEDPRVLTPSPTTSEINR